MGSRADAADHCDGAGLLLRDTVLADRRRAGAAVYLKMPFTEIEGKCKFGLRPADRERLAELCREKEERAG